MIPLINCPVRDLSSYYSGCTLFLEDHTPVQVEGVNNDKTFVVVSNTQAMAVSNKELFVQYLKPFFDSNGNIHGVSVARSYKRAPSYDRDVYSELKLMSEGSLPPTYKDGYGRLAYNFFVKPLNRRVESALWYYDECVGFCKDNEFYVKDNFIKERLVKATGGKYVAHSLEIK